MPRSVSWPVSRMWVPSVSSEAKASASAWPNSISPSSSFSIRAEQRLAQLAVDREAVGHPQQLLVERCAGASRRPRSRPRGSSCGRARRCRARSSSGPRTRRPPSSPAAPCSVACSSLEPLARRRPATSSALTTPSLDQLLGVDLGDRRVLLDLRRHLRLRVGGLVGLVVAVAAVADQVDDDVAAPLLAVGHRQPHRGDAGLDVVGVDVDDRAVEALRHVAGVRGRAVLLRVGGEADLVVGDQVDRAAGRVAGERLQVERLGDHALAGEGGVAVQQHRHRDVRVVVELRARVLGLGGAGAAGDHRVDELEVARVRVEAHLHLVVVAGREQALGAVVVLDVAGARVRHRGDRLHPVERLGALELGQDRLDRAAEVVGEDAEAAAVGHPDHDLLGAVLARQGRDLVEHRHGHVEALDREHLLAQVGLLQEALELEDLDQARAAARASRRRRAARGASRSRSSRAATSAAGARRGARSGRRS